MSDPEWQTQLDLIESGIVQGKAIKVQASLRTLMNKSVPSPWVSRLAQLAWRAYLPWEALRFLRPFVVSRPKHPVTPSNDEKIEYATILSKVGAYQEALDILDQVPQDRHPRACFARAAAQVSVWDYESSIALLLQYLSSESLTEYERLIARVNLLAAYVYEREYEKAGQLFAPLIEQAKKQDRHLLHGKIVELAAMAALSQLDFTAAKKHLSEASRLLVDDSEFDLFLLEKWRVFIEVRESSGSQKSLDRLETIRQQAKKFGHWETLRQCDRFEALGTQNENLLLHLYFGTPYESFRRWLIADFPKRIDIPHRHPWSPSAPATHTLDLDSGKLDEGNVGLKLNSLPLKLLKTLAADFYRPASLAFLCECLYPDVPFDPRHSPAKLHQVKKVLRQWCQKFGVGISVVESSRRYQLDLSNCQLLIPEPQSDLFSQLPRLKKLQDKFGSEPFTVGDAAQALNLSSASALRVLNRGIHRELVIRVGAGRYVSYQFNRHRRAA